MDVHAPHEPVHTWKDFAVHLAIVTIGLFIALMLESVVEYIHHRHIVAEARANIRLELEDNHKAAQDDLVYLQKNVAQIDINIQTLHAMQSPSGEHYSLSNQMEFSSLDEAAWRTARDTGALAYMPYDEVQRYSDIYSAIDFVNRRAEDAADKEFAALAPTQMGYDMEHLPPEEFTTMLRGNAQTKIALSTERQFIQQLDQQIVAALHH